MLQAQRSADQRQTKARRRSGLFGASISRIRQLEQHLAVARQRRAPAGEVLAAELGEGGHQLRLLREPYLAINSSRVPSRRS
jgi:hypothetical protein